MAGHNLKNLIPFVVGVVLLAVIVGVVLAIFWSAGDGLGGEEDPTPDSGLVNQMAADAQKDINQQDDSQMPTDIGAETSDLAADSNPETLAVDGYGSDSASSESSMADTPTVVGEETTTPNSDLPSRKVSDSAANQLASEAIGDQKLLELLNCSQQVIADDRLLSYMEKLYTCRFDGRDYVINYGQRDILLADFDLDDPFQAFLSQESLQACSDYLDRPATEPTPPEPILVVVFGLDEPQTKVYVIGSVSLADDYMAVLSALAAADFDFQTQDACDHLLEDGVVAHLNCQPTKNDGNSKDIREYDCLFRGDNYHLIVGKNNVIQPIINNPSADRIDQCSRSEANIIWDLVLTSFEDTFYLTVAFEGSYSDLASSDLNHDYDPMINSIRWDQNLRALGWNLINICRV